MADKCPKCGLALRSDPKFCPACGAQLTDSAAKHEQDASIKAEDKPAVSGSPENAGLVPSEERRFVLRKTKYGDTGYYEGSTDDEKPAKPSPEQERAHPLSLYLSLVAIILSATAIILVLIFAVFPSFSKSTSSDTTAQTEQTLAPTQPPTEPPITGTYRISEFMGTETGIGMSLLKSSTLEMQSDYTGKILFGGVELGEVTLDRGADSARYMNVDCTYTFDGNILTIHYHGITIVYKKA